MHYLRYICLIVSLFLFCARFDACAKEKRSKNEVAIEKKAKRWSIDVSQEYHNDIISGKKITGPDLEKDLLRFFSCLDYLPDNFIKRSGINKVVILDQLKLNGERAGGIASGNIMYLQKNFSTHTFFHELFHIFDDTRNSNLQWCKLNPKDFVYKGSVFFEADLTKKETKKVERESWINRMKPHFVSEYAMSFEQEDRAEVFAAMIVEGRNFNKRTTRSKVMQKKMDMIIDMTDSKRLLGRNFWKKRLKEKPLE